MSDYIVGLTGGIGSGKTAVSDRFAALGVDVVDADVVARQVVSPNSQGLGQIVERFGVGILNQAGELDRRQLRALVFADQQHKTWLDNLLHPLIRQAMLTQVKQANSAYCILSVPLLVENKLTELVDRVLVVDVPESLQRMRAASRDEQSEQQIEQIMNSQASRTARLAAADDIIDNSGDLSLLDQQIDRLDTLYRQLANATD